MINERSSRTILKDNEINHYTSMSEKYKEDWYVPFTRYIYNKLLSINDKSQTLDYLNAANGEYNDELKKKFLSVINSTKYIHEVKDLDILEEVDLVMPITRRIIGEYIRQPDDNYNCVVKDANSTMTINKKASDKINEILMSKLMSALEKIQNDASANPKSQSQQAQQQEQTNPLANVNIEEEIEKIKKEYFEGEAESAKALVESFVERTNLTNALIQQFFYYYSTEEVYSEIVTDDNRLDVNHIPPQNYYRYPSTLTNDVEDDIAGMIFSTMPYYQLQSKFKNILDKEDFDYLTVLSDKNISINDKTSAVRNRILLFNIGDTVSNNISDNISSIMDDSGAIPVYKIYFRTKRKYGTLTRLDETSQPIIEVVDETYELNTTAGDISIEWNYKDEVMFNYIIGDINYGVITKPQLLKYKREFLDDINSVKLPVIGKSGILLNYFKKPIPYKLIPYNIIYRFLNIKIQSEIAKFQGYINTIPESVLSESSEFKTAERLDKLMESNLLIFDDSQTSANALQAMRTIGNYHSDYIQQLRELKMQIKADAWETADMNQERYGEIDTRGGKANTEQAIIRISTGSILLFTMFDNYLERLYQAVADYSRLVYVDGYAHEFQNKSGNLINMMYEYHTLLNKEIGIFFKKSSVEREKLEFLRNNVVQAAMQNNQFLLAIEAIDNDNLHSIKKIASTIDESNKQRELYFKELEAKIESEKIQNEEAQRQHEYKIKVDVEHIKGSYEILKADKKLLEKMIEYSSFNPESNKYAGDIDKLSTEIQQAELELKRAQKQLIDAKRAEVKNKPKTVKK